MSTNTSISLDDHFSDFLAREVASGRYRSASEVVRAALRLLEDHETQMSALREALIAGEERGPALPFAHPELGRACDEIRDGYWGFATGRHLIFYVHSAEGVDVIRILHQRMDPTRHL